MCQMRASSYQGDDIFGLKKILQIDLDVKCFELIKSCIIVYVIGLRFLNWKIIRCIATLDMNKLIF